MAESAGRGSRSGTASPTAPVTVSAGESVAATSAYSGGETSQAVSDRIHRRTPAEDGWDVMASITPGSRRGGAGIVSVGSQWSATRRGNRGGSSSYLLTLAGCCIKRAT